MPNRRATAAVCRTWFDCTAPWVTRWSAPWARASPTSHSSLRILLPPVATTVQSSRLIQISGPPRWRVRFSSFSSGVGVGNIRTRGNRARCMQASIETRISAMNRTGEV